MKDGNKQGMKLLYISTPDGRTFEVDGSAEPIKWPGTSDQKSDAKIESKTYTATLTFKMGKRMREKMKWALYGFKTRKEYRKFKKLRKRLHKNLKIICNIKRSDNKKKKESLNWLKKLLKNINRTIKV